VVTISFKINKLFSLVLTQLWLMLGTRIRFLGSLVLRLLMLLSWLLGFMMLGILQPKFSPWSYMIHFTSVRNVVSSDVMKKLFGFVCYW
jgi:hypothetical protein